MAHLRVAAQWDSESVPGDFDRRPRFELEETP